MYIVKELLNSINLGSQIDEVMYNLDDLVILLESKQVGTIYHFTKPDHLRHLMSSEAQKQDGFKDAWHVMSKNDHFSTTRNHQLSRMSTSKRMHDLDISKGYSVRIALDGDKLAHNHKIQPLQGLKTDDPDIFNHRHNDHNRISRHSGEHEEVVKMKGEQMNIKPFIKRIDFIHNDMTQQGQPEHDMNDKVHTEFSKTLDKDGIEHSIGRKWNPVK